MDNNMEMRQSSFIRKYLYYVIPIIVILFFSFLLYQTHQQFKAKQISNFVHDRKLLLDVFENSFRQFLNEKIADYILVINQLEPTISDLPTTNYQSSNDKQLENIFNHTEGETNWIAFINSENKLISVYPSGYLPRLPTMSQSDTDYLNKENVFIRKSKSNNKSAPSIDIILSTEVDSKNYRLIININILQFIHQHGPILEPYNDTSFFFSGDDGTLFSILNVNHNSLDFMESGNMFKLGDDCLGCHIPTSFNDIKLAFDSNVPSELEYTNPDGSHQFRITKIYQFYNMKWGVSISTLFSSVMGVIEDNGKQNLILLITFILILIGGGYTSHRFKLKNMILNETKAQTARLNKLFENEIVGIVEIENDGTVNKMNEKFQKLFDVNRTETIGKNINSVVSQEKSIIVENIQPKQSNVFENTITRERIMRKDGKLLNIFKIEIPIVVDNKLIARYIVFQDVTEMRKSEEQRIWAMSAIRNSKDAINITDMNDNILFVNAGFEKMYQYNYDEAVGKNIFEIVRTQEDRSQEIDEVTSLTRTEGGWRGERLNTRRDETVFPIYLSTAPIKDRKGNIIGSVGISTDITKQKITESELKENERKYRLLSGKLSESNDLKNLLLDIITHDLKNPIGTAQGFTEMLLHTYFDIEELSFLKDSIDQSLHIIYNVTSLAKIEVGDQIEMTALDLSQMARDIISRFKRTLEEKEIIIDNQIQEQIEIKANPIISEILDNYVSNAIKYGGSGKTITLVAEKSETHITIRVNDLGNTIDEKFRDKVFIRKIQLERSLKGGRGLGLSIVKKIADAHHADVGVEPNSPHGNSFYIRLPR